MPFPGHDAVCLTVACPWRDARHHMVRHDASQRRGVFPPAPYATPIRQPSRSGTVESGPERRLSTATSVGAVSVTLPGGITAQRRRRGRPQTPCRDRRSAAEERFSGSIDRLTTRRPGFAGGPERGGVRRVMSREGAGQGSSCGGGGLGSEGRSGEGRRQTIR